MEHKIRIIELRNAIRYTRDQVGDDRCWLDYWKGYLLLPDTDSSKLVFPSYDRGIEICTSFYEKRKDSESKIPKKIISEYEWDKDLEEISAPAIDVTLVQLEKAWRTHRDKPLDRLTITDDKKLYQLLPESGKVPVDYRLPPRNEFLGTAKDCAGCPNFWKSHTNCKTEKHNPHIWGPCV